MPIFLQTIREFKPDNMIWDDRKGVMKSAGLWQKFKTFFNIGNARAQNAATLTAIKNAIFSSFPADDLKALAEERINQVRTDRVIGAAEIKGILEDKYGKTVKISLPETLSSQAAGTEFAMADNLFRQQKYDEAAAEYIRVLGQFPEAGDLSIGALAQLHVQHRLEALLYALLDDQLGV